MDKRPDNIIPIPSDARKVVQEFGAAHDRELLTILFTDLVDSTKLQSELGNVEASRLNDLHREIVREELAKYDAREISWAGDSLLAVFAKPSDAVLFALRMQHKHLDARRTEPKLPLVRVGIHLGEIVVRHKGESGAQTDDLFGLQVSEAARIMSVARGNQIYCSRAVFDSARGSLRGAPDLGDTLWVRHGLFLLKGSEDPVEICEVGTAELGGTGAPEGNDKCVPLGDGGRKVAATGARGSRVGLFAGIGVLALLLLGYIAFAGRFPAPGPAGQEAGARTELGGGALPKEPQPVKRSYLGLSIPPIHPNLAIAPDGSAVAYVTQGDGIRPQLAIQEFGELKGRILEDTLGGTQPFFSPDGRYVGFEDPYERRINRIPFQGGVPTTITEFPHSQRTTWHGDYIYYGLLGYPLLRTPATGGEGERITSIRDTEGGGHVWPSVLPEDHGILFTSFKSPDMNDWETWVTNDDGPPTLLLSGGMWARYIPTGHLVYFKDDVAMVAPFDLETRSVIGESVLVGEDGLTREFDFSNDGTLVYFAATDPESQGARTLTWVDMEGNLTPLAVPPKEYNRVVISPDGERAVIAASRDIWLLEFERMMLQRMTRKIAMDNAPVFIDDGRSIVFASDRGASPQIYIMPTVPDVGEFEPTMLTPFGPPRYPESWDPVGERILYSQLTGGETKFDIGMGYFGAEGDTSFGLVVETTANEGTATVSPNGKWVAYATDEVSGGQVYVAEYPSFANRYPVSKDGGSEPVWAPDNSALFFRKYPAMMRAAVRDGETFSAETPEELFRNPRLLASPAGARMYDVHPNGDRFLMIMPEPESELKSPYDLVVVENWFDELERIAPHPKEE